MKNKTIYILRHGETDYNKNGMVQGRGINSSLNENGIIQAKKAGKTLNEMAFEQVFISSLLRTKETVNQFIATTMPITSLSGFDEISWGNEEGKKVLYHTNNNFFKTLERWQRGELFLNIGGGESPMEVMERQKEAMEIVLKSKAKNILICMHGRALRILLCWLLNYPLNFMDGFPHENCSYYVLEYRKETFFMKEFNRRDHLK